ncbi:MAG: metallophosphoesterase [Nitrosomonadales bacterium]|nr:metallophosphoesterase [Nitrosomonadales bacterium]
MKLIHISDTHIGRDDNTLRFERVVDDLLAHPPCAPEDCVIVHTGDLIDSATDTHRRAARVLLDRLATRYRVLLCPGNHDYGDAISLDEEAAETFQQTFRDYIFQGKPSSFPVLSEVGANHAFIGLDSNAEELRFWERWFAEGHLGEAQLSALDRLLDSPVVAGKQVIIYLHHHPFSFGYSVTPDVGDRNPLYNLFTQLSRPFLRLKDAYSFSQVVRDRAQVLLFGHMHFGLDCSGESRKYGIQMALDGSSTTCAEDEADRMRYRVIDLADMSYTVRTLKLQDDRGKINHIETVA